jgi:hypothetical protein
MKKILTLLAISTLPLMAMAADPIEIDYDPPQRLDARFRLFKTKNMWNYVELDTATGKAWQVQFSVNEPSGRRKIVINDDALAKDGKAGRFTLHSTKNMYNFVLLDQDVGKTWQLQWSTDENRGIWPIEQKVEKIDSGWKQ